MPRASKQQLDKNVWTEVNSNLFNFLGSMNSKKLEKSFPQLLTKEERTMLAKRITLYSLILNDFSDLDIKQILKVSYETIRSAKLALETKDTNFQSDLKKLIKKEDPKFLKFLGLVLRSKTSSKARNQLVNNS